VEPGDLFRLPGDEEVGAPIPGGKGMKTKEARGLAKELLVDVDGAIAGNPREPEARHSAAASAAVLAVRLLGGIAINLARIAYALEGLEYNTRKDEENDDTPA
jgi:hypothetical protein